MLTTFIRPRGAEVDVTDETTTLPPIHRAYGDRQLHKEDVTRCIVSVRSSDGWHSYQCRNPRGKGTGEYAGLLCGTHARQEERLLGVYTPSNPGDWERRQAKGVQCEVARLSADIEVAQRDLERANAQLRALREALNAHGQSL